jgi:hypothetical protein
VSYWVLKPEVAGGLGESTVIDRHTHPPIVHRLHYEVQTWLGDTGCSFDTVLVTPEYPFDDLYPGRTLPPFAWLKIIGRAGEHDFGMSPDHLLVVSARALQCLRDFSLAHCEGAEFGP